PSALQSYLTTIATESSGMGQCLAPEPQRSGTGPATEMTMILPESLEAGRVRCSAALGSPRDSSGRVVTLACLGPTTPKQFSWLRSIRPTRAIPQRAAHTYLWCARYDRSLIGLLLRSLFTEWDLGNEVSLIPERRPAGVKERCHRPSRREPRCRAVPHAG